VLLDGAGPDAHFQLHAMIDIHPAGAARMQRYSRKMYRDVGGSTRDGSDYCAGEIDRGVFHAARRARDLSRSARLAHGKQPIDDTAADVDSFARIAAVAYDTLPRVARGIRRGIRPCRKPSVARRPTY
jgi:hypothetical protein